MEAPREEKEETMVEAEVVAPVAEKEEAKAPAPSLAHHVEATEEDWASSSDLVWLHAPRAELRTRLSRAKAYHQETEARFFDQKKAGEISNDLKEKAEAYLENRKGLIEFLEQLEATLLAGGSAWVLSARQNAEEKVKVRAKVPAPLLPLADVLPPSLFLRRPM